VVGQPGQGIESRDARPQHNNPFDRMLVAQARHLTFTLATANAAIRDYPSVAQHWAG
jgi:PIN domain nuclease of toxin-antitoxin system